MDELLNVAGVNFHTLTMLHCKSKTLPKVADDPRQRKKQAEQQTLFTISRTAMQETVTRQIESLTGLAGVMNEARADSQRGNLSALATTHQETRNEDNVVEITAQIEALCGILAILTEAHTKAQETVEAVAKNGMETVEAVAKNGMETVLVLKAGMETAKDVAKHGIDAANTALRTVTNASTEVFEKIGQPKPATSNNDAIKEQWKAANERKKRSVTRNENTDQVTRRIEALTSILNLLTEAHTKAQETVQKGMDAVQKGMDASHTSLCIFTNAATEVLEKIGQPTPPPLNDAFLKGDGTNRPGTANNSLGVDSSNEEEEFVDKTKAEVVGSGFAKALAAKDESVDAETTGNGLSEVKAEAVGSGFATKTNTYAVENQNVNNKFSILLEIVKQLQEELAASKEAKKVLEKELADAGKAVKQLEKEVDSLSDQNATLKLRDILCNLNEVHREAQQTFQSARDKIESIAQMDSSQQTVQSACNKIESIDQMAKDTAAAFTNAVTEGLKQIYQPTPAHSNVPLARGDSDNAISELDSSVEDEEFVDSEEFAEIVGIGSNEQFAHSQDFVASKVGSAFSQKIPSTDKSAETVGNGSNEQFAHSKDFVDTEAERALAKTIDSTKDEFAHADAVGSGFDEENSYGEDELVNTDLFNEYLLELVQELQQDLATSEESNDVLQE